MLIFVLAYLGGVLTIVSPCILPVLPFVFARADRPFVQSGLPMLIGMAVTFALVATLAAVAGGWAVEANQYGRLVAMALLALFGVALLFPSLATRMMEPVVALGGRLSQATQASSEARLLRSVLALARRRDRIAVGAVCWPVVGSHSDWRRAAGRKRAHHAAASGLCARRRHLARLGPCRRRQGLRRDEAILRGRGVDPA